MMGMDPLCVDEYAAFANARWTEIEPSTYWHGYDICPPNGFSSFDSLYMWNYHLPGFLAFSLANDEGSVDALDSFMFFFKRCTPVMEIQDYPNTPWWKSNFLSGGYTHKQCQIIVDFLSLLKQSDGGDPFYYDWEESDDVTLGKWVDRSSC